MIIPKLAIRNLLGAGTRTWLNVVVLSFSFVAIIWMQGLYLGMNEQASQAKIDSEIGGGMYWHEGYDPYDPLSLEDAHGKLPRPLKMLIDRGQATPILIVQGTIFPNGRFRPVLLKGIDPKQKIINIPSYVLVEKNGEVPALIGVRMAENTGLKIGDYVTVRWRDVNHTLDAIDVKIVEIMKTSVQSIDNGQIWLPLPKLREMTGMEEEATVVIVDKNLQEPPTVDGWEFKDHEYLLKDLREIVKSKTVSASILYFILLFLAMLAIFDTQVLSIFRRKKEMGTLMALGMTRTKVIQLFTLEGAMHGILAALVAAVYGIPLLTYSANHGWAIPKATDSYGLAIGETLFPKYTAALVIGTTVLVLVVTTIVSYLPTRKIAKLKPTDALRGRLS